jgi:hypothetical protein
MVGFSQSWEYLARKNKKRLAEKVGMCQDK